jgi:hypothetical protein
MTAAGRITAVSDEPLAGVDVVRSYRDVVLVEVSDEPCATDTTPTTVRSVDTGTGATTVIAGTPATTAEVPLWAWGLVSWVVGD